MGKKITQRQKMGNIFSRLQALFQSGSSLTVRIFGLSRQCVRASVRAQPVCCLSTWLTCVALENLSEIWNLGPEEVVWKSKNVPWVSGTSIWGVSAADWSGKHPSCQHYELLRNAILSHLDPPEGARCPWGTATSIEKHTRWYKRRAISCDRLCVNQFRWSLSH